MDFDDATEAVMLAAGALRPALEDHASDWRERHGCPTPDGKAVTHDLCRGAAHGLMLYLRLRFADAEWRVDGGFGSESTIPASRSEKAAKVVDAARWPGGMMDPDGVWRGHFWVAGRLPDGTELIVDLTADQFGYSEIVVEPADDPRYRSNISRDHPDCGLTMHEMAWGEHLTWCFEDHWAVSAPSP